MVDVEFARAIFAVFTTMVCASEDVAEFRGGCYFCLHIIINNTSDTPPVGVLRQGHIPFGEYTLPFMGLVARSYICATCISLFIIYNYYSLFPESSEDISHSDFAMVCGKTTINAVCANLSLWGGAITLLGLITPGLCLIVQLTP